MRTFIDNNRVLLAVTFVLGLVLAAVYNNAGSTPSEAVDPATSPSEEEPSDPTPSRSEPAARETVGTQSPNPTTTRSALTELEDVVSAFVPLRFSSELSGEDKLEALTPYVSRPYVDSTTLTTVAAGGDAVVTATPIMESMVVDEVGGGVMVSLTVVIVNSNQSDEPLSIQYITTWVDDPIGWLVVSEDQIVSS